MQRSVTYNATIVERIDLTPHLAIFRIKPDAGWASDAGAEFPDFEGGQYAVLGLNNMADPDKGSVLRPYSIASPPEEKRYLEFYMRYVDQPESKNPFTHLLWKLGPGDRIHLGRRITGHFTMSNTVGEHDPRLKLFVAAGTGIAPFVSILASCIHRGLDPRQFAVLHGVSRPNDLAYRDEIEAIFNRLPSRYNPTVSREHEAGEWKGRLGRVETFFDSDQLSVLEERLHLPKGELLPARVVVFACGLYGTIHNTLVRLLRRGFVPNDKRIRDALGLNDQPASLFFEQYDKAPVLNIDNQAEMEKLLAETPFINQFRARHG